ncbi:MAG: hypothetical protein HOI57_03735 [Rhodospirillaceae bacterium]|jgi:uncharacterized peroxidase-related enzyme|nr:hypothetical protein [Rhodospirillaceae bacterium]MBT3809672.1 hypothetical protein [Rhodospirillaceae bacterium]MBT3929162.1 hypothetical protein [Rhodospirillaceae bacterium]MBT4773079.1 hypothetical protein [Rhodospirillaceae bacterium]MBT5768497.1 hypothetical protein [Rhodospirillaceae bacterium]
MGLFGKIFGGGASPENKVETPTAPDSDASDDQAWEGVSGQNQMACPIPFVEEDQATGEIAEIYDSLKKAMQVPEVPNMNKVLAQSPQALKATVAMLGELFMGSSLPQPIVSMLLYSISLARRCQYCSSMHRLTCRMVGVDETMLSAVGNNLGSVTPERVQAIVAFGIKAAMSSADLTEADYDKLRDMGISDSEIVEIVALSGLGVYLDIVAESLKIEVDVMVKQGLAA